ncbi:hypothetical protein EYZ11_010689 [Aspergillus tanneri]|uniref:Probable E3 ubiquitin ligase complex SCF subunit sconB n=1 Tax=Aspergillus tanneri TaxID=1220188 RepID=A0A4S3J4R1_9EURO|nr:uncharacterized protein ATNIH1004_004585 [Aspergillus tanneri]KAA8648700.1 hypothetical protein ATNIH1004_004585 [Aspergillus tanneri]THC89860.1 hypothetical protein EYZ11_010689 [Aspergillus tanneri]
MAKEVATTSEATIPRLLRHHADSYSDFTAPSVPTSFRLDEGYSDETRSQPDKDPGNSLSNDVMNLPDWLLATSEAERAELAYSLLRSLSTSTVAAVVDRLSPLLHMDPVLKLPPEITSEIFSYLDPHTLVTASLASRAWRNRIFDCRLWRGLYTYEGWRVDVDAVRRFEEENSGPLSPQSRKSRSRYADADLEEPKQKKRVPPSGLESRANGLQASIEADTEGDHLMSDSSNERNRPGSGGQHLVGTSSSRTSPPEPTSTQTTGQMSLTSIISPKSPLLIRLPSGAVKLNWVHLYAQRRRLEERWTKGCYSTFQLPHPSYMEECHQECVYSIQFWGKWLVSGSRDRTVRVWDLDTKRLWYRPLVGHTKSVLCLQFDPRPSEDVIISGSSDKSVIVWRFSTGEKIHQIPNAHDDSVLNLRFDARYLVTCSKDKLIKVWSRCELTPADKDYPNICNGPGVTYPSYIINTASIPSPVLEAEIAKDHAHTLAPYTLLMSMEGHGAAVNAIQINEDEIVSASGDRLIKVWNLRNGACKKTLIGHEKGIACVQFDSRRIISGSNDNTVRIFDHVSGAEVACLRGHRNLVRTVQAGFGDPPGAEEAMRLEALAVDNEFFDAQRSSAAVGLGPGALRRAGHYQNTTGSRNPKDVKALGARIPPGGGGSRWARIVSGSYDESIVIWKKDSQGKWVVGLELKQAECAEEASSPNANPTPRIRTPRHLPHLVQPVPPQAGPQLPINPASTVVHEQPHPTMLNHHLPPPVAYPPRPMQPVLQPTSRVFKLQFDCRKIICASQDPRIVGWDFVGDDVELNEACQFFSSL